MTALAVAKDDRMQLPHALHDGWIVPTVASQARFRRG